MTLRLEYSCTKAEMKEAESLHECEHYGGGSKWKAQLKIYGIVAVAATLLYFRFRREIAPKDRVWFVALVVVVYIAIVLFRRMTRQNTDQVVRLEVSEKEVFLNNGKARTTILWSGFSKCLESPNLFALLDRPKALLYVVPKRAFPDEGAQKWFRAQARQIDTAPAVPDHPFVPDRSVVSNGIAFSVRLNFRDYIVRNFTSWRMKGIVIGIFTLVTGMFFFAPAPPNAVNSSAKVFFTFVLPFFALVLPLMVVITSLVSWQSERKNFGVQHIVLTPEGIEFADRDSSGRLAWNTYTYYHENHWSFFVWQPGGSWLMFPKREFTSPSDLAQCRALLEANLKPSRWFFH